MVYGLGFGIYTFGGLSMMAAMSPNIRAGAYLGLWSIAILLFKGLGTLAGGALRDFFLSGLGLDAGSAYGLVFLLAAAGLAGASFLARGIDVAGFSRESAAADGKSAGHDGLGAIDF
jgi:BCD family chlorophyll transporter-like MFS transporter